jgi:hypothetical protein
MISSLFLVRHTIDTVSIEVIERQTTARLLNNKFEGIWKETVAA